MRPGDTNPFRAFRWLSYEHLFAFRLGGAGGGGGSLRVPRLMVLGRVHDVAEPEGAAEADVVTAGEGALAALELAVRLCLEVGVERAAANALERHGRLDLVAGGLPGAERAAGPFPGVAHQLQDAVEARPFGQGVGSNGVVESTARDVGLAAVH